MDKYFKVPMAAARSIVDSSDGPELLAGYMTLRRWSVTRNYEHTAAGAKAIRLATGVTDFRAKRVLLELQALRFGDKGEKYLLERTGKSIKNAREYVFGPWDGLVAYVPDILMQGPVTPLQRLCNFDCLPETKRDALLMLLHAYASVNYGEFLGIDPSEFIFKKWTGEGLTTIDDCDIELGYYGAVNGLHFWLMREEEDGTRYTFERNAKAIYGDVEDALDRCWEAHELLLAIGMLCRVAIVHYGRDSYPLWVYSPAYREALSKTGIASDLANVIYRIAGNNGFDPDNLIIRYATGDDRPSEGSGLFFCVTPAQKLPLVKTIYAPLFHAPNPTNMDGLMEMAKKTADWSARLKSRPKRRASA